MSAVDENPKDAAALEPRSRNSQSESELRPGLTVRAGIEEQRGERKQPSPLTLILQRFPDFAPAKSS